MRIHAKQLYLPNTFLLLASLLSSLPSERTTPPLQSAVNILLTSQRGPNLLKRNIAPDHAKPARLTQHDGHDEPKIQQPIPLAPCNALAPNFAHTTTRAQAASSRLDARLGCQTHVFVVRHVEVALVRVVDDVEARGGDEEGEGEGREMRDQREF
jgi:hypothetical protein